MNRQALHCLLLVAGLTQSPLCAGQERSLADVFQAVDPAVVEVLAAQRGPAGEEGGAEQSASLGSGFLISKDGRIMTAAHVVEVADRVAVRFATGEVAAARILALDPHADVALVQAESVPAGIAPVALGNSDGKFGAGKIATTDANWKETAALLVEKSRAIIVGS